MTKRKVIPKKLTPAQLRRANAYVELHRKLNAEIAAMHTEVDLPSDYNDPEQMMIYEEIDELLTALDDASSIATLEKKEGKHE